MYGTRLFLRYQDITDILVAYIKVNIHGTFDNNTTIQHIIYKLAPLVHQAEVT